MFNLRYELGPKVELSEAIGKNQLEFRGIVIFQHSYCINQESKWDHYSWEYLQKRKDLQIKFQIFPWVPFQKMEEGL
jgi:hypothetical protein